MDHMIQTAIAYHRNGCNGEGFHIVAFRFRRMRGQTCNMVATLFSDRDTKLGEPHPCNGRISVIDADLAARGILTPPDNQWDGTWFEPRLRDWIAAWERDRARTTEAVFGLVT